MKRWAKCPHCNGKGVAKDVVMDVDNGDGTRTATLCDLKCFTCKGTGMVYDTPTKFYLFMELDVEELGKLIAKHIPSHACPKEVRDIWFSLPPDKTNSAYEKAWVEWLLSPAKEPLK